MSVPIAPRTNSSATAPVDDLAARWIKDPDAPQDRGRDVSVWLLGRMAAICRVALGVSKADWCQRTGLKPGQVHQAEAGRGMSAATARALLAHMPTDWADFTRARLARFIIDPDAALAAAETRRGQIMRDLGGSCGRSEGTERGVML